MIVVYILALILGACIGSFLNVVIYRVPNQMSIIKPASHCPNCKTPLGALDNIPILSWLFLGGRCRHCKAPISVRYIIVELLNVVLWLLSALLLWKISPVIAVVSALSASTLLAVAFVDFEHKWIPDRFQIALLVFGIVATIFDPILHFSVHIIGFFVGGGVMLLFYGLGWLLYKKEALGLGDVKLMAVCGLLVGWQGALITLFVGAIVGAISCLVQKAVSKTGEVEYAFAPYLALGALIALFFGNSLVGLYLSLF